MGRFDANPDYVRAKAFYFSEETKPSVLEVAKSLELAPSTVRYWAKCEAWKLRRDVMNREYVAQAKKESESTAPGGGHNATEALALVKDIAEIRSATKAKLRELMDGEVEARQRRQLVFVRSADMLAAQLGGQKPMDAERLARAIGILVEKAELLAGQPASISEKRGTAPKRRRKPAKAIVAELGDHLDGGTGEPGDEAAEERGVGECEPE